MRDRSSPEMYAIRLRVKEIIDALYGLVKSGEITAPDGQPWTAGTLKLGVWDANEKLNKKEISIDLEPQFYQTWGFLFGFGKAKNSQVSLYLPRGSKGESLPYNPGKPKPPIQEYHILVIQYTLRRLGLWTGEIKLDVGKAPSALWWHVLDEAWRFVTRREPPPRWTLPDTTELDQWPRAGSDHAWRCSRINATSRQGIANFTGRGPLLAELNGILRPGRITGEARPSKGEGKGQDAIPATVVVLHGLGGIGKTSIATEFAHAHQPPYRQAFFLGADTPDDLERNLAELAGFLHIEFLREDLETRKRCIASRLSAEPSWLMIFDNVDSKEAAQSVRLFIAKMAFDRGKERGNVIITARHRDWDRLGYALIHVEEILEADAEKYLLASTRFVKEIDTENARRLARELGCIPSLLEIAAAYIRFEGCTFKQYEKTWKASYDVVAAWEKKHRLSISPENSQIRLAASWQTSFAKLSAEARQLLDQLAWLAPEPIPEMLTRRQRSKPFALSELEAYSFVKPLEDGTAFTINPALQQISRAKMQSDDHFGSLAEITKILEGAFKEDRRAFVPHVLSVLHFLHDDRFRDLEESSLFDSMGSLVVSALFQAERERIPLQYLPTILGDFYEVEPLYKPLELLMNRRETWPDTEKQLLASNNYVLRYAMAEVLADKRDVNEIERRLHESVGLNEFEYAGYALALKYAKEPTYINPHYIEMLANRDAYCGRSILGDLFINIVFRSDPIEGKRPHDITANGRFWGSTWQFIELDVYAVEAAELFMANKKSEDGEVQARIDALKDLRDDVDRALEKFADSSEIAKLLQKYFSLGESPSDVRNAFDEIGTLSVETRRELMWVLFSHPIWSVAEAAATVLSDLLTQGKIAPDDGLSLINDLLHCKDEASDEKKWRVQFGANEAAFAVRNINREFFYLSVEGAYDHWNCKIVGLCAENLIAHMLNLSARSREALFSVRHGECEGRFGPQFAAWVNHTDCWVLEHVHKFFHTLYKRGVSPEDCIPNQVSQLLAGIERWYSLDREEFLRRIDRV